MTDLRDKIAWAMYPRDIKGYYEQRPDWPEYLRMAECAIALIRENVPPLVWKQRGETYWVSGQYKLYRGTNESFYLEHPDIVTRMLFADTVEIAMEVANEHHVNAWMKEGGLI